MTDNDRAARLRVLKDARQLISKPENWAKGAFAYSVPSNELQYVTDNSGLQGVDMDLHGGAICPVCAGDAKCWCAIGAIEAAMSKIACYSVVIPYLADEMNGNIPVFNDHKDTTHEMVLAAFDRAIAKLEGPEPTLDAIAVSQAAA